MDSRQHTLPPWPSIQDRHRDQRLLSTKTGVTGHWTGGFVIAVMVLSACHRGEERLEEKQAKPPVPQPVATSPQDTGRKGEGEAPTLTGTWCPSQKRLNYEVVFAAGNGASLAAKDQAQRPRDWPWDWMMFFGFGNQGAGSSHPPRWDPDMPRSLFRIQRSFETHRLGSTLSLVIPVLGHKGGSGWSFVLPAIHPEKPEGCVAIEAIGSFPAEPVPSKTQK